MDDSDPIKSMLDNIQGPAAIEGIAKSLSSEQLTEIFRSVAQHLQEKLPFILVGISNDQFTDLLHKSTEADLKTMTQMAGAEPLQHKLTVLSHYLSQRLSDEESSYLGLCQSLSNLNTEDMGYEELNALYAQIADFTNEIERLVELTKKALTLSWNAHRTDLIETIGYVKERLEQLLFRAIGHGGSDESPATGLYGILEKKLGDVYHQTDRFAVLDDQDPAIEGVANLSVNYFVDYWQAGLLPHFSHLDEPSFEDEAKRSELMEAVINNLSKAGLKTVLDLKRARIFSKKTLTQYIRQHSPHHGH